MTRFEHGATPPLGSGLRDKAISSVASQPGVCARVAAIEVNRRGM
jgi:hypothetical protein